MAFVQVRNEKTRPMWPMLNRVFGTTCRLLFVTHLSWINGRFPEKPS